MSHFYITAGLTAVSFYIIYRWLLSRRHLFSVENKVILITGATSGLGEACAITFCKAGAKLILCSRRSEELKRVHDQLKLIRPDCDVECLALDLSNLESIADKTKQAISIFGHIDILLNIAGMSYRGKVVSTVLDVDIKLMNVNYFGQIALTKEVLCHMLERGSGFIIAVGSVQSKVATPFRSAYTASKHALQAFFDSLRAEVSNRNIHVTVFNPGYIKTNLSINAITDCGSSYGVMDETTATGMEPAEVAERLLLAVRRKEHEVTMAPLIHRIFILLRTIMPSLYFTIVAKLAKKQYKKESKKIK